MYGSSLKMAIMQGHMRSDVDVREATRTLVAAVVGSRLLADTYDDDPFDRLADAWRIILRSIAPDDVQDDLCRLVETAARERL